MAIRCVEAHTKFISLDKINVQGNEAYVNDFVKKKPFKHRLALGRL